jgi:hypothetical protein
VQPLSVVDFFNEQLNRCAGVLLIAVPAHVDLLRLQRLHERLRFGVVIGITRAAHADGEAMGLQFVHIRPAAVLHPSVRMMHDAWLDGPVCQCPPERPYSQFRAQVLA